LKKTAEAYNVETQKGEFDHKKIRWWSDVDLYKNVVEEYLIKDLKGLNELVQTFNKTKYEMYHINITSFQTISHCS